MTADQAAKSKIHSYTLGWVLIKHKIKKGLYSGMTVD